MRKMQEPFERENQKRSRRMGRGSMFRAVLVVSLSLNVFVFASLAMYGTWIVMAAFSSFWRGIISLFIWIASFGAGTLALWKIIEGLTEATTV